MHIDPCAGQFTLRQLLQEPPLQPPQPAEAVPLTGLPPLEAEKRDKARLVRLLWQYSHGAGASAWLMGRITSNLDLQFEHSYSYIGMKHLALVGKIVPRQANTGQGGIP